LIDDDETELAGRGEDGTAGADNHLNVPRDDPPPVTAALGISQVAVQHGDVAATTVETCDGLRRQRDFGNEDYRFLPLLHRLLDGAQINLGLAAAGDAMEEKRFEAAFGVECGAHLFPDTLLVGVQNDLCLIFTDSRLPTPDS